MATPNAAGLSQPDLLVVGGWPRVNFIGMEGTGLRDDLRSRMRINGLGQIVQPLEVVKINNQKRLVVTPVAALGTDALLALAGAALLLAPTSLPLKILGVAAGSWGLTAGIAELVKLQKEPIDVDKVIQEEVRQRVLEPQPTVV